MSPGLLPSESGKHSAAVQGGWLARGRKALGRLKCYLELHSASKVELGEVTVSALPCPQLRASCFTPHPLCPSACQAVSSWGRKAGDRHHPSAWAPPIGRHYPGGWRRKRSPEACDLKGRLSCHHAEGGGISHLALRDLVKKAEGLSRGTLGLGPHSPSSPSSDCPATAAEGEAAAVHHLA